MDLELNGKTALVTGGSKGIGLAVAEALAREGCNLHLASRTAADLNAARERIQQEYGVTVVVHPMDLSQGGSARELAEACGDADILINNAGAIPGGDLESIVEERWREAWDLKVFGYINITREFYRIMKDRGHGVIVNVIGLAGERPSAGYIAGSAGNASLMAFTRGLGSISLDEGVRVVAVNPGPVETGRITQLYRVRARDEFGDPERWTEYLKHSPLGRFAKVEEVADVVTFLASPRANYVCGTVVTIDGGLSGRGP